MSARSRVLLAAIGLTWPTLADRPAGMVLEVRLLTALSSYSTKTGTPVAGIVTEEARTGSDASIPSGATVRGTVTHVHRVGLGFRHERARIDLAFQELEFPGGRKCPLRAKLIGIENAREEIDREGSIRGVRSTGNLSHRAAFSLASLPTFNPIGLVPVFAIRTCLFRFPNPEIEYYPGTDLQLEVLSPHQLPRIEHAPPTPAAAPNNELAELETLVAAEPSTSFTKRQGEPMDLVNLLFVGSRQAIENAFRAAGWSNARSMSTGSGLRAVRAVVEARPYRDAPMRTLLVDGAEPDLTWQKALNTFTKRDHLRIWRRPVEWHGQTVWLSAATRDVGLGFSFRYGFIHETEENIDLEREDVVRDLRLTGCVDRVLRVYRPEYVRRDTQTDGAIAAVMLNACESPRPAVSPGEPLPRPGSTQKFVRRVVLSARNHYFRNNLPWEVMDLTRAGWRWMRRPNPERPLPAEAAIDTTILAAE